MLHSQEVSEYVTELILNTASIVSNVTVYLKCFAYVKCACALFLSLRKIPLAFVI